MHGREDSGKAAVRGHSSLEEQEAPGGARESRLRVLGVRFPRGRVVFLLQDRVTGREDITELKACRLWGPKPTLRWFS